VEAGSGDTRFDLDIDRIIDSSENWDDDFEFQQQPTKQNAKNTTPRRLTNTINADNIDASPTSVSISSSQFSKDWHVDDQSNGQNHTTATATTTPRPTPNAVLNNKMNFFSSFNQFELALSDWTESPRPSSSITHSDNSLSPSSVSHSPLPRATTTHTG